MIVFCKKKKKNYSCSKGKSFLLDHGKIIIFGNNAWIEMRNK